MNNLCNKHSEPYTLYCNKNTCHRPICSKCTSLHPSHEIFDTQKFADYLSCVVENELQTCNQSIGTLTKISEEYGKLTEQITQSTVEYIKRIQVIINSIQDTLNGYLKSFEEKAQNFIQTQSKVKEGLSKLRECFEEKINSYNNTYEIIMSKRQSSFNDLYQIWLYLNEQTSVEIAQEEMGQVFSAVSCSDPAANEVSSLIVTLKNLQSTISSWTWIQG